MYLKMINSYTFGVIVVNGKKYYSDIIIYPNKVDDNWWREEGHLLIPRDLEKVVDANCGYRKMGNDESLSSHPTMD